jgi:hypothetical protein
MSNYELGSIDHNLGEMRRNTAQLVQVTAAAALLDCKDALNRMSIQSRDRLIDILAGRAGLRVLENGNLVTPEQERETQPAEGVAYG